MQIMSINYANERVTEHLDQILTHIKVSLLYYFLKRTSNRFNASQFASIKMDIFFLNHLPQLCKY